jgi:cobalt-zinc-cadmium efflux system outer membrane protein
VNKTLFAIVVAVILPAHAVRAQSPSTITIRQPPAQPANTNLRPVSAQPVSFNGPAGQVPDNTRSLEPIPLPPTSPSQGALQPPAGQSAPVPPATGGITLDDLESMAMGNNPTLAQAAARVRAQRGNWVQQGLYPNPRLSYVGDEIGDENASGFQGFKVAQEVVTRHKLRLAQNVASNQVLQAEQEYATQEFRVRNDVKLRFYDVLLAQRTLDLSQELERISLTNARAAQHLFEAAEVGRNDVLQAQIEADNNQLQTIKSRITEDTAWKRLAIVVGVPDMQPRPLAGDLRNDIPSVTWEDTWTHLSSSSPELSAAQAKVGAARWAVQKACADRCPNWEVEGGYSHDNATGFDTGGISVMIPIPIFNRNQGAIRQAQAELSAAEAEVDRVSLDLRNRLADAYQRYAIARQMVDRYEQSILPNARKSVELSAELYTATQISYPALLLSQRTYLQTQMAYLDALRELRTTSVLLEGLLLSDSLPGVMK